MVESAHKKIRAAVIGAGYLGRFHAQKYAAMADVELVAVVDTDADAAAAVAAETGCTPCGDLAEVLGRIDVASVVVPNIHHYDVARPLLAAGIHVLLEKPLTNTLAQADELIAIAADKGVVLQSGHLERFNPAVRVLRERATAPLFIEAHRLSGFKNRATDVDVILDLMIHDIDIVLSLVRRPVEEIRASGHPVLTPNVDIANARLTFAGGCTVNLTASRVSLKDMRKIRVFQDGAYISADCAARENLVVLGETRPDAPPRILPEPFKHGPGDNLMEELVSFVKAVRGEHAVEVTGQEGRDALAVAIEINETIARQRARAGGG
jgi:predicted dehydrogenase